jgi:hypothetical protein
MTLKEIKVKELLKGNHRTVNVEKAKICVCAKAARVKL